jgi:hypothetical protein
MTTATAPSIATIAPVDGMPHELAEVLRAGASHQYGLCCLPGQVTKLWPLLREAERLGYVRFIGLERPWITPQGRLAIGAPTEMEADRARMVLLCAGARKPLTPAKRDDPRTDFDYRSYKANNFVCILAVKARDDRPEKQTIRIVVSGSTRPQGLGGGNSIIMDETKGDEPFVLAVVPDWLQSKCRLPTYAMPLPEDQDWSDADRALWERLRNICFSINSRIRNAGRAQHERRSFGAYA